MLQIDEFGTVSGRILQLVDYFHQGNKTAFGRAADIQSGVLAGIVGGRESKPGFEILQKLLTAYPLINPTWLLFGRGEMLNSEPHQTNTVGALPARPITVQYPAEYRRDHLLQGNTSFDTYKQNLLSKAAMQEFANHFDTTVEELAASLPPRKKKAVVHHEMPAFISQLKNLGILIISMEQHTAHIGRAVEERAHTAKAQEGYGCFEVTAGSWAVCKSLPSPLEVTPDSLCVVVTQTTLFATHVRPGSSKSPGDIQVYIHGSPPDYLLAEDILQVWACEMWLNRQV